MYFNYLHNKSIWSIWFSIFANNFKATLTRPDVSDEMFIPCCLFACSIPMDDGRLNELGSITSGAIHAESSVSFTHASLSGSMQQLIDDINAKRKEDDHLVENYKKASEMHVRFGGNNICFIQ